ncbi:DUF3168 domain-containing protein [Sinorhizobium meliloti]|nr:DUF3168 domain-containing protein [Sinorhizobium meliloti]
MAISPDLELQGVVFDVLRADPEMISLVNGRIYDRVPENKVFPYVSFGPTDDFEDDADCIYGTDLTIQLDVWSREVGFPEAKRICNAARNALHDKDLQLTENALVQIACRGIRMLRDPDGLTSHGIVEINAFIERQP